MFCYEGKAFRVERCFVPQLRGINMISSDKSSVFAAGTEYTFKTTQIFTFKILVRARYFDSKHYINIICMRIFEIHNFRDYFYIFILKQEF